MQKNKPSEEKLRMWVEALEKTIKVIKNKFPDPEYLTLYLEEIRDDINTRSDNDLNRDKTLKETLQEDDQEDEDYNPNFYRHVREALKDNRITSVG